jgi:hypothetical protein
MKRRLALLLLLLLLTLALALPGAASADSHTVRVPRVHDANLSLVQYSVAVSGRGKPTATIINRAALGDRKVIAAVLKVKRHRFELVVVSLNPRGGAAAVGALTPRIKVRGNGSLRIRARASAIDTLSAGLVAENEFDDFCVSTDWGTARLALRYVRAGISADDALGLVLAIRLYLCDEGSFGPTAARDAWETIEGQGVDAPDCYGHPRSFGGSPIEAEILLVCLTPMQALVFYGSPGSSGTSCSGPSGSACSWDSGCTAFDLHRAVCFSYPPGWVTMTTLAFRAGYSREIVEDGRVQLTAEAIRRGASPTDPREKVWLVLD